MVEIPDAAIHRVARAGAAFVKAVLANEKAWAGTREMFEVSLHRDELDAWQALCEAAAELEAYGG